MKPEVYIKKIREDTGLSKKEIQSLIEAKKEEIKGLISDEGALFVIAKELGVEVSRENRELLNEIHHMDEFEINTFLSLRLEEGKTNIYIKNNLFRQCKFLLLDIPIEEIESVNEINSIDEAAEKLGWAFHGQIKDNVYLIPPEIHPETEFWGHCSNLQVWAENNYNTKIIHRSLAFPLLKTLSDAGDPIAKKAFVEEIGKRLESGHHSVITYLNNEGYIKYLPKEFICEKLEDRKILTILLNGSKNLTCLYKFLDLYIKSLNNDNAFINFFDVLTFREIFDIIEALYDEYDADDDIHGEFKTPDYFIEKLIWEKIITTRLNQSILKTENIEELFSLFDENRNIQDTSFLLRQFSKFFVVPVVVSCLKDNFNVKKVFVDEFNKRLQSNNAHAPEITIMQCFLLYCDEETLRYLLKNSEIPLSELLLKVLKKISFVYRPRDRDGWRKLIYDISFWCDDFPKIIDKSWSSLLNNVLIDIIRYGKAADIFFIFDANLFDLLKQADLIDIIKDFELGLYEKISFFLKNEDDIYLYADLAERAFQYKKILKIK
ncbi:MAG: DUF2240 family protein [Candidatus Lokiarchaeota archaeon]|nr:DUF2240 family protein [Candidatus Lokiarchaeota archaeon]